MVEVWTTPKTWALDDVLDAPTLNQQVRDNIEYLANRPMAWIKHVYSSNENIYPTATGTFTHITDLDVSLTTNTGRVMYTCHVPIVDSARAVYFDVYIPELNIYLSTDSTTPATYGLARSQSANNAYDVPVTIAAPIELAAGTYTFQLMAYASAATVYIAADTAVIPIVMEV